MVFRQSFLEQQSLQNQRKIVLNFDTSLVRICYDFGWFLLHFWNQNRSKIGSKTQLAMIIYFYVIFLQTWFSEFLRAWSSGPANNAPRQGSGEGYGRGKPVRSCSTRSWARSLSGLIDELLAAVGKQLWSVAKSRSRSSQKDAVKYPRCGLNIPGDCKSEIRDRARACYSITTRSDMV